MLHINTKNAKCLLICEALDTQLQLIATLIIAKFVSISEATFASLQIPVKQTNIEVKYIDSKPFTMRTKLITRSRVLGIHPIDIYCIRPKLFEEYTFIQYFKKFEADRMTQPNAVCHSENMLGNYIYESNSNIVS